MKTGDRVICINASGVPHLKQGKQYIVHDINSCCRTVVDVGFTSQNGVRCQYCGKKHSFSGGISWFDSKIFRKVEEKVNYVKLEIEVEEPCLN